MTSTTFRKALLAGVLLVIGACGTAPEAAVVDDVAVATPDVTDLDGKADSAGSSSWQRDWTKDPAVVVISAPGRLFAVSDIHGGYDRLVTLLDAGGLATVSKKGVVAWTGGNAVLVVAGDSIDKGDRSIPVLDLLRLLEAAAPKAGGRVIVLLGNHEAEFLADPENHKADALRLEIASKHLTPEKFASASTAWGKFLRRMPIAAVVSGWYVSHAGHNSGRSSAVLSSAFRAAVDAGHWDADVLIADDSPLEANDWWSTRVIAADLSAANAKHLVMGHDPNAFAEKGLIAAHFAGKLVHIDTGLSPAVDNSKGRLLRVDAPGTSHEVAVSISHKGNIDPVDLTAP
jgi:hypothetical protein